MSLSSALSALFTLSAVAGALGVTVVGPNTNLTISNVQLSPDGNSRSTVVAGGSFPGPIIKANKGDHFKINVVDQLTDNTMLTSTTVHWHGLYQKGSNWADGTAMVTQCPINPGNSFEYDFSVPDQAGTYWYHSHLGTQYCDGLRGPIVIYDPNDPFKHMYDVDDETTVITLADWYHTVSTQAGPFPLSDSVLINGKGRYPNGPTSNLSVISVEHGKRYRFRLISMSCDPTFTFSIDGHNMTIVEVDGVNHQPLIVDSIQILAGQRYSFILEANQKVDNYWIRSLPSNGNAAGHNSGGINAAILRYSGANTTDPTTTSSTSVIPLQETNLHPLENPEAPGGKCAGCGVHAINMDIDFSGTQFTVNDVPYNSPPVPVLLQIMSGAHTAQELMPQGSVYTLPANQVIEISFPMASATSAGAPHPIHLHGHTFSVVRSAGSDKYNYDSPVRRDVVSVGGADANNSDNVTIRFVTDNSGPWFLHCHIDWHLQAGFAVVMAENPNGTTAAEGKIPTAWDQLCPESVNNGTNPTTKKMRRVHHVGRHLQHGSHDF
ncbi:laccase [Gloeophyllum trabeum ATCC 11539]|uniref:Laccase n=1 Tax=Gloeophyllum trabeum (strain ATCC 11539 / FP-39264 / Madison 617) TaxID=670483 RepID=S7QCZ9_GLOTA|nr:laccase [Gloeophyllum trabeum ATCC 11539]EPQ57227.1 laccase [Gloeophyllum trabeum ATCC 11539]